MRWHFGELAAGECVHEACLTDTVSAHQAVFAAIGQFQVGRLEQGLASDDEGDVFEDEIVVFAACALSLPFDLDWWQFLLLLFYFVHVFFEV